MILCDVAVVNKMKDVSPSLLRGKGRIIIQTT